MYWVVFVLCAIWLWGMCLCVKKMGDGRGREYRWYAMAANAMRLKLCLEVTINYRKSYGPMGMVVCACVQASNCFLFF
ncbi:hypothetical protein ACJW30_01G243900 [Castanea mollissima]